MFSSSKYSYLLLRLGLASVFLWFGIDKFLNTAYWLSVWLPPGVLTFINHFNVTGFTFIYIIGTFEILVGLSLVFSVFIKIFAFLAILFLIAILVVNRLAEPLVRDIAIIGGLLAIMLWPDNRNRF